jgi:hypothetical protein
MWLILSSWQHECHKSPHDRPSPCACLRRRNVLICPDVFEGDLLPHRADTVRPLAACPPPVPHSFGSRSIHRQLSSCDAVPWPLDKHILTHNLAILWRQPHVLYRATQFLFITALRLYPGQHKECGKRVSALYLLQDHWQTFRNHP